VRVVDRDLIPIERERKFQTASHENVQASGDVVAGLRLEISRIANRARTRARAIILKGGNSRRSSAGEKHEMHTLNLV